MGRLLDVMHRGALGIAGVSVFVMAIIGGVDVLGTVVFNRPLPATYEATEALMVLVVFLALGHLQATRGHIAVDIVAVRLPATVRWSVGMLAHLLAASFFGLIAWTGWELAWSSLVMGEYAAGIVAFPIYPSKFALAIGATLATLQALRNLAADDRRPEAT